MLVVINSKPLGQMAIQKSRNEAMPDKLLIVEDDDANLEMISSFLQRRNYQVLARSDVNGALSALEQDLEIGLVVTDLRMPGPDGFDMIGGVADLSRQTGRTLPVIVVTGHGTLKDEQRARGLGAKCFLRKPIDLRQLLAAIDTQLDVAERRGGRDG